MKIEPMPMHMSGKVICFLKDVIVFHLHLSISARLLFSSSLFTFRSNSPNSSGWVSYQRHLRFSLWAGSLSLLCDCLHKGIQQEADEFGRDGWWWFIRCDCHLALLLGMVETLYLMWSDMFQHLFFSAYVFKDSYHVHVGIYLIWLISASWIFTTYYHNIASFVFDSNIFFLNILYKI